MTELTSALTGLTSELKHADALPLDRSPAAVYLGGLSAASRRTMRGALDAIAALFDPTLDAFSFPWHRLRFQHTQAIRSALDDRYAPGTANRMLSALRGTLKAAWRLGHIDAETYHQAVDVGAIKGESLPAGRSLGRGELSALMDACAQDATIKGARDAAMIALLYAGGLRRAELIGLDLADYERGSGGLRVKGKGNKERLVYVTGGAADALADWLRARGEEAGPLFAPIRRGGHIQQGRLTTQAVYTMLKERAAEAGIASLSPHDMRRTFVGDLLDAGADISTVQRLAGHASVATTARYDRRPETAKRKAAELLHVPYSRRDE